MGDPADISATIVETLYADALRLADEARAAFDMSGRLDLVGSSEELARVALSFVGDGEEAVENALFTELNKVNATITTRINYLSVIGVCTPMIGLTGTVTGMMSAFATLGTSGVGDPSKLSGAIGEVLIATASGLFIAVPAFMFFYFLRNRLQSSMTGLQDIVGALFRKMPYGHLKDAHVGEEEFYAAMPNWVNADANAQA